MKYRPGDLVLLCNMLNEGLRLTPCEGRIFNGTAALILDVGNNAAYEVFADGMVGICHEFYLASTWCNAPCKCSRL